MIHPTTSDPAPVISVGPVAHRILRDARCGRVVARFERSLYADFGGRMACFGDEDIGNGPLNVVMRRTPAARRRTAGDVDGAAIDVRGSTIRVAGRPFADLRGADLWWPRTCPAAPDIGVCPANLYTLAPALAASAPAAGLVSLVLPNARRRSDEHLLAFVSGPFADLKRWLAASLAGTPDNAPACPSGIAALIGAGPGLTPSGDDLLCGAMVTLHRLGELTILARLAGCVAGKLGHRTNAISAAHLAAAMDGLAAETMIDVIDDLMTGRHGTPAYLARRLDTLGATSGWDGLAGVVTVLVSRLAGPRRGSGQTRCETREESGYKEACRQTPV